MQILFMGPAVFVPNLHLCIWMCCFFPLSQHTTTGCSWKYGPRFPKF